VSKNDKKDDTASEKKPDNRPKQIECTVLKPFTINGVYQEKDALVKLNTVQFQTLEAQEKVAVKSKTNAK